MYNNIHIQNLFTKSPGSELSSQVRGSKTPIPEAFSEAYPALHTVYQDLEPGNQDRGKLK